MYRLFSWVTFFLVLLGTQGCPENGYKQRPDRGGRYKDVAIDSDYSDCDAKCSENADCKGYSINEEAKKCVHYKVDTDKDGGDFTADAGWETYEKCDTDSGDGGDSGDEEGNDDEGDEEGNDDKGDEGGDDGDPAEVGAPADPDEEDEKMEPIGKDTAVAQQTDADDKETKKQTKHKSYDPFNLPPCPHGDIKLCDDEASLLIHDRFSDKEVEDCEDCNKDADQSSPPATNEAQTGGDTDDENKNDDEGDDECKDLTKVACQNDKNKDTCVHKAAAGEDKPSCHKKDDSDKKDKKDPCDGVVPENKCKKIDGCTWEQREETPGQFLCYKVISVDDDDDDDGQDGQDDGQDGQDDGNQNDGQDQNGQNGDGQSGEEEGQTNENDGQGTDDKTNQPSLEKSLSADPHTLKLYENLDGVKDDTEALDASNAGSATEKNEQASVANAAGDPENVCHNLDQELCGNKKDKCIWERIDDSDTTEDPACYSKTTVHMETKNSNTDDANLQDNLADSDDHPPRFNAIKLYAGFILVLLGSFTVVMGWSWHKSVVDTEMVESLLGEEEV